MFMVHWWNLSCNWIYSPCHHKLNAALFKWLWHSNLVVSFSLIFHFLHTITTSLSAHDTCDGSLETLSWSRDSIFTVLFSSWTWDPASWSCICCLSLHGASIRALTNNGLQVLHVGILRQTFSYSMGGGDTELSQKNEQM